MKSIILFRHGKSDWDAEYDTDHNRPLALRGSKAARKMGCFLAAKKQVPDLVISSTALRAKTTVELAMEAGEWVCPLKLDKAIYGGAPEYLLQLIRQQDDQLTSICLVGHEPNFSRFLSQTTDGRYTRFPTASMAKIDFAGDSWKNIDFGRGVLDWIQRPKEWNH